MIEKTGHLLLDILQILPNTSLHQETADILKNCQVSPPLKALKGPAEQKLLEAAEDTLPISLGT